MTQSPLNILQGAAAMPSSLEAERSVLGAFLQSANALSEGMERLNADDFYHPQHAVIFEAMQNLHQKASAVDLVTMFDELTRLGKLAGIGGPEYLVDLINFVPSAANAQYYIDIVLEKSTLRKLISAANDISGECYAQSLPLSDVLSHAEKSIFDIVMKRTGGQQLKHIAEVLTLTYAKIEELARSKGAVNGIPTGFASLDRCLTGLHGGELVLVGARPSMGKTSFAVNIATHAAHKGFSIAIFSLEMPREQIALRILCGDAMVNMQSVRQGALRYEDWTRLAEAIAPLSQTRLYIDDTAGLTPSQIRSRARRLMIEKGLDLIVIDYMQLMSADNRTENRQLEVSEISRKLKAIALELKIPVIACAQLSRANMQRTSKRPMLSDLRDSGSIEQDADVVMFLHREAYYAEDKDQADPNQAEVIIAKQRNGPLDTIRLYWDSEYTLFRELS